MLDNSSAKSNRDLTNCRVSHVKPTKQSIKYPSQIIPYLNALIGKTLIHPVQSHLYNVYVSLLLQMMDCKMDKHKSRKTKLGKAESAGSSSEATENSAQVNHKPVKKKRSKKGANDGDHSSGRFSFRYLLYNSPLYPQRFRFRNRRSVGKYT